MVDADDGSRDAVQSLARTMNLLCETYASGSEFLEDYDPLRPGCLVLEIRIPDVNGVEIQERLAAEGSTLPVIFLTSQATVSIAVRAMRAGAVHVIEKPFREHELWDVILEAVDLDRERRLEAERRQCVRQRLAKLDAKDQSLLGMIAQGLSKEAMASELGVCVRTVELRRNQLMKKLRFKEAVELVKFALAASNGHSPEMQSTC